ncbi:MAG: transcriptional repressor [Bacteroidota bacterium]
MSEAPISILKSHNLRITNCRVDVIRHFMGKKSALSVSDLANRFKQYDRVTLSRTLNCFLESGLLHKIPNESGTYLYGLGQCSCTPENHFDNHIHFKCNICGQIECLVDREIPKVIIPKGYKMEGINLIVDGICAECA